LEIQRRCGGQKIEVPGGGLLQLIEGQFGISWNISSNIEPILRG